MSLLHLKKRITTVQNVSKTTRAMQMIAASKLKRAQNSALSGRPYIEKLISVTQENIKTTNKKIDSPYLAKAESGDPELLIVFAPDKGLCGGLVSGIINEFLKYSDKNKESFLILIGNKMEKVKFAKNMLAAFPLGITLPAFDIIYPVLQIIDDSLKDGKVKKVNILYPKFISLFTQMPSLTTLLPLEIREVLPAGRQEKKEGTYTLFEPSPEEILPSLLRHYLEINLYQFFLETYLAEQAARMIAMKNATDNAAEVVDILKLEYNKTRQEKITNEILDIGSGAMQAI